MKKRLVIGLSGASGAPIAIRVLEYLHANSDWETHLVISDGFIRSMKMESTYSIEDLYALADIVYDNHDLASSISSGTFRTEGMLIVPCSMKTVAGIASGYSETLLLRAADVSIKEGRKLVLAIRESPLSPIHLKNLLYLSEIGIRIVPPMINYYAHCDTLESQTNQFAGRLLNEFGVSIPKYFRWSGSQSDF